jgi:cytochrome bd-type quinol oxidase subunit 2
MDLDPVSLSRIQFFWVIALHILLPAFTVRVGAPACALAAVGRARVHHRGEHLDAVHAAADIQALVRLDEYPSAVGGAAGYCGLAIWLWQALGSRRDLSPFLAAMGLFLMCYLGLGISLWPMAVPYQITLWDAAAGPSAQTFLGLGTMFLLPVILTYTGWSYWVFRGKVRADSGYH